MSKIVSLAERTGHPSLGDIPNQLRQLADSIESGEEPALTVLCVVVGPDEAPPALFAWGDTADRYRCHGILQVAAAISTQLEPA